jgi:hypothetical protein
MGGIRAHFISDPMYRNPKTFMFGPLRKMAGIHVVGLAEEIQNDTELYGELDSVLDTALLASDAVEELTRRFTRNLKLCWRGRRLWNGMV